MLSTIWLVSVTPSTKVAEPTSSLELAPPRDVRPRPAEEGPEASEPRSDSPILKRCQLP